MSYRSLSGKLILLALAVVLVAGLATSAAAGTLKGRDFARLGEPGALSGTLAEQNGEWFLKSDGKVYALHLGPRDFLAAKGMILKEGRTASIQGFVHGDDVAVGLIETDGKSVVLRDSTGRPAWAGTRYSNRGAGN